MHVSIVIHMSQTRYLRWERRALVRRFYVVEVSWSVLVIYFVLVERLRGVCVE